MAKVSPHTLKGIGYLVSTISVFLLAIVSWSSASQTAMLTACLLAGAATSIVGMFCRWLSYEIEKRRKEQQPSTSRDLRPDIVKKGGGYGMAREQESSKWADVELLVMFLIKETGISEAQACQVDRDLASGSYPTARPAFFVVTQECRPGRASVREQRPGHPAPRSAALP
ncbi:hypothetical protein [Mesorhizobium sp. B1-1-8]|uniref:hypothetical protein n=1 Tax=Mesorhizobium sp. B1-1-8 TaxID=2589976 RepID=UPI001126DA43|nr:hypothetical protein [Mesorhizobium sp. B1-1-8]UCI06298.1 hypothetical protein FJ974_21120 [Mesorhizobium sp. B1-1-8]